MNIYSFDDCSILNMCEIEMPKAFKGTIGKDKLNSKNFTKLNLLISKLKKKFRFVPSTIKDNIVKTARNLIEQEQLNVQILGKVFELQIMEQLDEFSSKIEEDFEEIQKNENINSVKLFFTNNERKLKKERNLPEDDDLMIIAGYVDYASDGEKHLITEDEHFWGYKDLILKEFNITITEERNCNKLALYSNGQK